MLRTHPCYALPAMGSFIKMDPAIPTAGTNGRTIFLSPTFIHRMPVPHVSTVVAHESIHIICGHPHIIAKREWPDGTKIAEPMLANQAMDHWINLNLKDEGFQFPDNLQICADPRFRGMTIRKIYDVLLSEQQQRQKEKHKGGVPTPDESGDDDLEGQSHDGEEGEEEDGTEESRPGNKSRSKGGQDQKPKGRGKSPEEDEVPEGKGGIENGDDVIPDEMTPEEQTEHRLLVRQAYEAAKAHGRLPSWFEQIIEEIKDPKISYKDLLQQFLRQSTNKEDISWRRLNRRYLPDILAPTMSDTTFGNLIVALDTSGSVWGLAPQFLAEFNGILKQLRPLNTTLVVFDAAIQGEPKEFAPGETVEPGAKLTGGGGTDFKPIFKWVMDNNKPVDAMIVLTDMYGDYPAHPPSYPVLWVTVSDQLTAPFGTVVKLDVNS